MDERRRFPRAATHIPIRFIQAAANGEYETRTYDLSGSGVACEVSCFLPLMAKLQLTLLLPAANHDRIPKRIACEGAVVRVEPLPSAPEGQTRFRVAIFFTDIAPDDRQRIVRYVEHRLPTGQPRASGEPPPAAGAR